LELSTSLIISHAYDAVPYDAHSRFSRTLRRDLQLVCRHGSAGSFYTSNYIATLKLISGRDLKRVTFEGFDLARIYKKSCGVANPSDEGTPISKFFVAIISTRKESWKRRS